MKIAHLIISLGTGGAERLLVDYLPYYKEKGINVCIIQLSSRLQNQEYLKSVNKNNIEVYTLSSKSFRNPFLIYKLIKLIKKEHFDIVHTHLFPPLYFMAVAKLFLNKVKIVYTDHSIFNRRLKYRFLNPIEVLIHNKYDTLIAISKSIKHRLETSLKHKDIRLIQNGLDATLYENAVPLNREFLLKKFSIPINVIIILMTSRFNREKDHKTLIKSLSRLNSIYHLVLLGDGILLNETKAFAHNLGLSERVHFVGFNSNVAEFNKTADLIILSSNNEGFSGVTLEALASGKPFVGSNVSGINDILEDEIFLFERGDEIGLSKKIDKVFNDNDYRTELIKRGKEVVSQFSIEKNINLHINLYNELILNK